MKMYIITEELLKESISGLRSFGKVAVETTVEKLKNLKEKDTTVKFHFEQKGFNAHTGDGVFTYDTPEHALQAVEDMKNKIGFTNIEII
jgi:hypothetical protein